MCAFKDDDHYIQENADEEPTEMTAMTGETRGTTPDRSGTGNDPEESRTSWDHSSAFMRKFVQSPKGICITAAVATATVIFLGFLLSKIVVGSFHIGACNLDPFVPIYLVSSGALFLCFLAALLLVCLKCRHRGEDESDDRVSPLHLLVLFYFFLHIVLQLAGSVCVIRARNDLHDLRRAEASTQGEQPTLTLTQQTVKLFAPEVTPEYPLMEPAVLRVASVKASPSRSPASCSSELIDFAFGAVIFELVVSGVFFILVVASLCELAYIVCYEPTVNVKKAKKKAGHSGVVALA